MYCVRCGVALQQGVKACPLCATRVYHPEIEEPQEAKPYPRYSTPEEMLKRSALLLIVTGLFLIPMVLCLMIELWVHGAVAWSGFVIGGLLVGYVSAILPCWFRRANPVIFFPVGMAAVILFLLYACLKTSGHWFLSFVLPMAGALLLLVETVIVLMRYVARGKRNRVLIVIGSAGIVLGLMMLLLEFLLHITFPVPMLWWSLIPMTALALIGALLLTIGLSKPLSEAMHKRFFL